MSSDVQKAYETAKALGAAGKPCPPPPQIPSIVREAIISGWNDAKKK